MYFLQVQTISAFGGGKLRSEKAEIFYNTTSSGKHQNANLSWDYTFITEKLTFTNDS